MTESISFFGDIVVLSSTFKAAYAYNGKLYTLDANNWRRFDLTTLAPELGPIALTGTTSSITLLGAASSVITGSTTTIDIVENSSGFRQTITGGQAAPISKGQLSKGNPTSSIAFAASNTNNNIVKIDGSGSTITASVVSPAALSGTTARSFCLKDSNWLIGTANGKVIEINSAGTSSNTITLPTTPNVGTAPTRSVSGISYFNDKLATLDDRGVFYVYSYIASSIDYINMLGAATTAGAANGNVLCEASSGLIINGQQFTQTTPTAVNVVDITVKPVKILESVHMPDKTSTLVDCGIDNTINKAFVVSGGNFIRVFDIIPSNKVMISTRVQDPITFDIVGNIIRLRRNKKGRTVFELESTIIAGANNLSSTHGNSYIEIGMNSGKTKYDLREFNA